MSVVPIDDIVIRDRSRRELRNIESLARSIGELGLLHPPVVRIDDATGQHVLVAGARRLAAMRLLGWASTPVTVAGSLGDDLQALTAEGEENTEREPFTPSEAVAHAERIRVVISAQARERQTQGARHGGMVKNGVPCANLAQGTHDRSERTRDVVAKAVGIGHQTLDKARMVVESANDPELPAPVRQIAQAAVAEMDRTGKVDGAFRKVKAAMRRPQERDLACPQPSRMGGNRRKHHQQIEALIVTVSGGLIAFEGVEVLDDSVTAEEAGVLSADLLQQIQAMTRINKLLRERTSS